MIVSVWSKRKDDLRDAHNPVKMMAKTAGAHLSRLGDKQYAVTPCTNSMIEDRRYCSDGVTSLESA